MLLGVLLAATVSVHADPEEVCGPRSGSDLELWREIMRRADGKTLTDARAKEALRIGESPDVLRLEDRLFLAVSDDDVAKLTDCRYGEGLRIHLYEDYDKSGGFYVVATHEYEDFSYTLVMKPGGKQFSALSRPLWSPDAKRFAHGRCDQLNDYNTLQIMSPLPGDLQLEVTIEMPCEARTCRFAWESATSLSVACQSDAQQSNADTSLRVVLEDGTWKVVR